MKDDLKADLQRRMNSAFDVLTEEFKGLRTGRASPQLLEPLMVDAYGSKMPLPQVGTVNVLEPRLLGVQVWDSGLVRFVEKAIRDANMGLNPSVDGNLVRVPLPDLTQERRQELAKMASKYAEGARVAVRGVRRDGMEQIKKGEKDKILSEDAAHRLGEEVQKMTDDLISKIDTLLVHKEKDIMTV